MLIALILNIVGGILAGLVFSFYSQLQMVFASWRFKQVYGRRAALDGITLVYEELALRKGVQKFSYEKPGNETLGFFSISRPIPIASVRAVSYLASSVGKFTAKTPSVRSDLETRNVMDLNFICFGGPGSNVLTASCQDNTGNRLARFNQQFNEFVRVSDGSPLVHLDPNFDYGLILKVHPAQFPRQTWIACAGIGERGTSGAAWFIANKWEEIRRHSGSRPFAALVRVEPDVHTGRDQSALLEKLVVERKDWFSGKTKIVEVKLPSNSGFIQQTL
ncbi:MAG: hypothetical protein LAN84_03795 [Acidobacteriia bacterium]|nr:hypothetical protein [Terriglobia bacterium]